MPVRKTIPYSNGVYFITFTCVKWIPFFQMVNGFKYVYNWYDYLKGQGHFVLGYVIMPNHVHSIIAFRESDKSINAIISNGKRFMAYAIVGELQSKGKNEILLSLNKEVNNTQKYMGKKHEVFEPSFDWKECNTLDLTRQKLDYIHWNPCKGETPLAVNPQEYLHSSAKYYLEGVHSEYEVMDYMKMLDMDLSE